MQSSTRVKKRNWLKLTKKNQFTITQVHCMHDAQTLAHVYARRGEGKKIKNKKNELWWMSTKKENKAREKKVHFSQFKAIPHLR